MQSIKRLIALGLFLCAVSSFAQIAFNAPADTGTCVAGSVATCPTATGITTTSGNLLAALVIAGNPASALSNATDSASNTYSAAAGAVLGNASVGNAGMFYAKNITGAATTKVSGNFSPNSNFDTINSFYITGADTSSPLDTSFTSTPATSTTFVSASFNTVANVLVLVCAVDNGNGTLSAQTIGGIAATAIASTRCFFHVFASPQTGITANYTTSSTNTTSGPIGISIKQAATSTPHNYGQIL